MKQPVLTGAVWKRNPRSRAQEVRRTCEMLKRAYGLPRFENPEGPLDDLIFIMLSNRTLPSIACSVYRRLKLRFSTWEGVMQARSREVRRVLKPAGLSGVKTGQIKSSLRMIVKRYGECSLDSLKRLSPVEAEAHLTDLPGVSEKVAKCVMIYTMGFAVLPVDVHVHRISQRLGWTTRKRADQCHAELECLVPPNRRYEFHVGCVAHGRQRCHAYCPKCSDCCIRRYCKFRRAVG